MLAGPTFLAGGGTRGGEVGWEGRGGGPRPHFDSPLHSILQHKFLTHSIRFALKLPDPRNATAVLIQMITLHSREVE